MRENLQAKHWLLIADGEALPVSQLQALSRDKCVLVLDGAYYYARDAEIKIDVLLGDFDTIARKDLEQADASSILIIEAPDQNKTDLQKGLAFLDDLQALSIDMCAATGKRLQHTLYNLRMLKKFHRLTRPLRLFTANEMIRYAENAEVILEGNVNDGVAILGFPNAVITSHGLQYDMSNRLLEFEKFNSVSNKFAMEKIYFEIEGGVLLIVENRK